MESATNRGTAQTTRNRQGAVLIALVSIVVALSLFGAALFSVLSVDMRNVDNYNRAVRAFHCADAGVRYVLARARAEETAGTLVFDQAVETVNYSAPAGFDFDPVTNLVRRPGKSAYIYRVVGKYGRARATIEATIGWLPPISLGLFGDDTVQLQPSVEILSYHSDSGLSPSTSTGEAPSGTNGEFKSKRDPVDGTLYLGESSGGTPATFVDEFTTSSTVVRTDRIDPDPLGLAGGPLAADFARVAVSNDNSLAVGATPSGSSITIKNDVTLISGDYYVDEIDMGAHKTLTINAASGPVNIYLTGESSTHPQFTLIVNPGECDSFRIFSNSNEDIYFSPQNDFIGFIYAPLATIRVQPGGNFMGALWGNEIEMQPGGQTWVDIDFVDSFHLQSPALLLSWKQIFE